MTRRVKELRDLEIDEISLVDKGANQHARTVIAKRHDEEDTMEEYFDADGDLVDAASLEPGDVIYDADGNAFEVDLDDEAAELYEEELEPVGKSHNPFELIDEETPSVAGLREAFSKAMTDGDRDQILGQALSQLEGFEEVVKRSQYAAETERQLRLEREYVDVAKNYSVGLAPEELGPVLMRMAESMDHDDCVVIAKALDSATAMGEIFDEVGQSGAASNSDVYNQVEAYLDSSVSKSDLPREAQVSKLFEDNPDAYDDYLAEQQNR